MPKNSTEINGSETSSKNKSYELITEELVKDGLQNDKGKSAELLSWEIKDFTKKGDGYTSFVTSVTVKYRKDKIQSDTSYVLKINPLQPPNAMSYFLEQMFTKEKIILTCVLEEMNEHLKRIGLEPIKAPKLYASNLKKEKEVVLLENLRTQGFRMHDRRKGQDYHHAIFVMEELGRFHASSLFLEESIAHFDLSWFEYNGESAKLFDGMLEPPADGAINYLNKLPKYEKCVKWLITNKKNLGRYFIEGFKPRKPFEVLIHGDAHTNNMLFKYNSKNELVDMRFVDLQETRLASPASEINYYIYTSLTGELRSKYLHKLLNAYYESFSKVLNIGRRKIPYTFKELEEEVEKGKLLGFVTGLMILPFLLFDGDDDVVDLGEITEENRKEFEERQKQNFQRLSEKEGPFKDRFLALFDEMLESNIFDENIIF